MRLDQLRIGVLITQLHKFDVGVKDWEHRYKIVSSLMIISKVMTTSMVSDQGKEMSFIKIIDSTLLLSISFCLLAFAI